MEHADAIISDCFWYVICVVFLKKPEHLTHSEFLLDRIAANYVSFTLIEESDIPSKSRIPKGGKKLESMKKENSQKERFFKGFYDIVA